MSPEEIEVFGKLRNRIYCYDFLLLDKDMDTIVRDIKVKREAHGYSKPKWVILDGKYGVRTEIEGRSWEDELRRRGLGNIRLSQSKPGDVELGHKLVREYLTPKYSTVLGVAKPGLLFAKEGCKGKDGPIHQMFNYQYSEKHDKPEDKFKDYPDVVRYMILEQPVYMNPDDEQVVVSILKQREDRARSMRRLNAA